jgi:hypothetical protein
MHVPGGMHQSPLRLTRRPKASRMEALEAALIEARARIQDDLDLTIDAGGGDRATMTEDDAEVAADIEQLLAQIDAALRVSPR